MGYTLSQAKAFIAEIGPLIQKYAKEKGYHICSPIIAQAICESAAGTSSLGYKYHNYFGMKCGSKWTGRSVNLSTREEYTAGTLTNIKANFRVYDSMEEGVAGYFKFISSSRYSNLKDATTLQQYATMIKQDGYATSSTYVNTIISIANKYGLQSYDWENVQIAKPTLRIGDKNEEVKVLQSNLNRFGYGLYVDGDFGKKTEEALIDFQKKYKVGTIYDGIYGKKSYAKMEELLK